VQPTALIDDDERQPKSRTSYEEQLNFFKNISLSESKPVILSLIPPYNKKYIPKEVILPKPLTEMYDENSAKPEYNELLKECSAKEIILTEEDIKAIEENTREQAKTNAWFNQRAGRITASKFKYACHTNVSKPSKSLIKSICYPQSMRFQSIETDWGISNESNAINAYLEKMTECHEDVSICDSGLQVNSQWPFIGASSPDGLVNCKCCGAGLCEIKCPYTAKDGLPTDAANKKDYCLKKDGDSVYLNTSHHYYYQVQCQLFVSGLDYCDFIIWTPQGLYVERILPDVEFWVVAVAKATTFFNKCVLPEIVGKFYTRPSLPSSLTTPSVDDDDAEWCTCQRYIEGSVLVGCDNSDCKVKWYHLQCLRLTSPPEGAWLYNDCHQNEN